MKNLYKGLAVLGVAILLAPVARAADDVPNFNKRGDNDKEFAPAKELMAKLKK